MSFSYANLSHAVEQSIGSNFTSERQNQNDTFLGNGITTATDTESNCINPDAVLPVQAVMVVTTVSVAATALSAYILLRQRGVTIKQKVIKWLVRYQYSSNIAMFGIDMPVRIYLLHEGCDQLGNIARDIVCRISTGVFFTTGLGILGLRIAIEHVRYRSVATPNEIRSANPKKLFGIYISAVYAVSASIAISVVNMKDLQAIPYQMCVYGTIKVDISWYGLVFAMFIFTAPCMYLYYKMHEKAHVRANGANPLTQRAQNRSRLNRRIAKTGIIETAIIFLTIMVPMIGSQAVGFNYDYRVITSLMLCLSICMLGLIPQICHIWSDHQKMRAQRLLGVEQDVTATQDVKGNTTTTVEMLGTHSAS